MAQPNGNSAARLLIREQKYIIIKKKKIQCVCVCIYDCKLLLLGAVCIHVCLYVVLKMKALTY